MVRLAPSGPVHLALGGWRPRGGRLQPDLLPIRPPTTERRVLPLRHPGGQTCPISSLRTIAALAFTLTTRADMGGYEAKPPATLRSPFLKDTASRLRCSHVPERNNLCASPSAQAQVCTGPTITVNGDLGRHAQIPARLAVIKTQRDAASTWMTSSRAWPRTPTTLTACSVSLVGVWVVAGRGIMAVSEVGRTYAASGH